MWYILDKNNIPVKSGELEYVDWIKNNPEKKIVKQDNIKDIRISTIFLGLNHSYNNSEKVLWETMIFGGESNMYLERYSTYEEAVAGHEIALNLVKKQVV